MNDFNQVFRIVDKEWLAFTVVRIISEQVILFLNIDQSMIGNIELKHSEMMRPFSSHQNISRFVFGIRLKS